MTLLYLMSVYKKKAAFIFTVCFISACSKSEPVVEDLVEPSLAGWQFKPSLVYSDNQGNEYRYSLSIPELPEQESAFPLVVYLHGRGGNERSELLSFSKYVDQAISQCDAQAPLIVFPSNVDGLFLHDQGYHIAKGLVLEVEKMYRLKNNQHRLITGFSIGGAAATRTGIIYPESFAASFSWAGGLWPNDQLLFDSTRDNSDLLKQRRYQVFLYIGGEDSPELYNPLIQRFDEYGMFYDRVLLAGQKHNLNEYWSRTQELFKRELCARF